jgi:hypothetical protein
MADKRTTPEAPESPRPKKRAVPTIDLTATEVPAAAAAEPPHSEPPPQEPQEPPISEPPFAEHEAARATEPHSGDALSWLRANLSGPTLTAGVAGAGLVTLILFGLWLTGYVPIRYAGSTATRARVTALEIEVGELKGRPAGAVDSKAIDALNARIGKIEETIAKLPAGDVGVNERVTSAENAMKALGVTLTALNRRSDDVAANAAAARERADAAEKAVNELRSSVQIAATASAGLSSADLDALQKRIASLEQAAKATVIDTPARLALTAAALRDAVNSGAPLAATLTQAKTLGADDKILAALEPFAASGVPTQAALAAELRALLPGMLKTAGTAAPEGGFIERLQANAGKLVRIRPVDAPPGDDAAAILARLDIDAAHADIAAALADLGKLPDAARVPAQAWIAKAQGRQAALTAARAFAADAAQALGKP